MKNLNYTQVPNEFIDEKMNLLSGTAAKILIAICRKIFGWHKKTDYISYSQLKKITGIKSHVSLKKGIDELEFAKLIDVKVTKNGKLYDLNIEDTMSKNDRGGCQKMTWGVSKNDIEGCQKMTPQKKDKETIQKKPCDVSIDTSQNPLSIFCKKFEKLYNIKYNVNFGKDNKIINDINKFCQNSQIDFIKIIDEFFKLSASENYVLKTYGYTITTFKTLLNICVKNHGIFLQKLNKEIENNNQLNAVKKSTEKFEFKKMVQEARKQL